MWKNQSLEKKLTEWSKKELIDESTSKNILEYELSKQRNDKRVSVLPVLAGVLISLGILSFVASNWLDYSNLMKLMIMLSVVTSAYGLSDYLQIKGLQSVSIGARFIGLMSFGASIVLIGQMFHIQAYDASLFLIWGVAAFLIFMYDRHVLFLMTTLAVFSFGLISYSLSEGIVQYVLVVSVIGAATYFYKCYKVYSFSGYIYFAYLYIILAFYIQTSSIFPSSMSYVWPVVLGMIFYGCSMWIKETRRESLKNISLLSGVLYLYYLSIVGRMDYTSIHFPLTTKGELTLGISFLLLVIITLYKVYKEANWSRLYHLLVFSPVILLIKITNIGFVSLGLLLLFSLIHIVISIQKKKRNAYRLGVFAFVIFALSVYFQVTYSFMSKSIFFIIAGVSLIVAYFISMKIGKGWNRS